MNAEEKLNTITAWLNENYSQDSENYNIFLGAKPEVIRLDGETAISFWACGAIVCIGSLLYFIIEDDGSWWIEQDEHTFHHYAYQTSFSIGWAESFSNAIRALNEYVKQNGKPIYYSGTETICCYSLTKED